MEIVLLGTSAALPTLRRRPTATAVVRGNEVLLFDCGEGTQIQYQKAQLRPGKLTRIFVSHFHGDHFYGLIGFLTSLQLLGRKPPLYLYGPKGLREYLQFMQRLGAFQFGFQVVVHEVPESCAEETWDLGAYTVTARPLKHRLFSLGYRLEEKPKPGKFNAGRAQRLRIPEGAVRRQLLRGERVRLPDGREIRPEQVVGPARPGKRIAICFDTRPCENAVRLAQDVDLLIHDGTFDENRSDLAQKTGHSTVVEAAKIAKRAGARKLVLGHISQRYKEKDEPELLAQAKRVFPNTVLGRDLLRMAV